MRPQCAHFLAGFLSPDEEQVNLLLYFARCAISPKRLARECHVGGRHFSHLSAVPREMGFLPWLRGQFGPAQWQRSGRSPYLSSPIPEARGRHFLPPAQVLPAWRGQFRERTGFCPSMPLENEEV